MILSNPDNVQWYWLFENSIAIDILKNNQDKINWYMFSQNPAIFELDFQAMSIDRSALIRDELLSLALRPERVAKWHAQGHNLSSL